MAENQRIDDLRRRVQKDPASIAFAQLAEELRRAGELEEATEICRAGLALHPGYLSARVTLGRALVEIGRLDDAQAELEHVLASAPENLAAIRGLAEIAHRRGDLPAALGHYRSALTLAKNDPDLQETVHDLSKKIEPPARSALTDGLSLEQVTRELFLRNPAPVVPEAAPPEVVAAPAPSVAPAPAVEPTPIAPSQIDAAAGERAPAELGAAGRAFFVDAFDAPASVRAEPLDRPETRVIAALEQWLEAIHVTRGTHGA